MSHKCKYCEKVYTWKYDLNRHLKAKHADSSDSKFECYMCDKTFNRKNILNEHLKREHGVVVHDYEYSDDANATPPPMQRASLNLNDVRAHEEVAVTSYSKLNEHPNIMFKGAHTSSKSKPYQFKHPLSMMVAGHDLRKRIGWRNC